MAAPLDSQTAPGKRELSGQTVVLLEDDELVRRATERVLRRFGAEVVSGSGSRAMTEELARRRLTPTCVIADFWLSREEDGVAAACAVLEATRSSAKGLILTGDTSEEIASKVSAAGFQLLRKPVNVESLLKALTAKR